MTESASKPLALLPSVEVVLADPRLGDLEGEPRSLRRQWVRRALDCAREEIRGCIWKPRDRSAALERVIAETRELAEERLELKLRRVWNATGILLHTNLGRAVLPREARRVLLSTASGYSALEIDLRSGKRTSRLAAVRELIPLVSGAESGFAVNNNAAAVFLTMAALASGREVLVSRGELVEIGGSFRLPEILEAAGVRLREVGTTNRTRLADYERALSSETAVVLQVHRSNFRLEGFCEDPKLADLAAFSRKAGLPLVADLGSGALRQHRDLFPDEPVIEDALDSGADVVCVSADKLLGLGQAGIIAGKKALIEERILRHPIARAVRLDKTLLTVLEAGLRIQLRGPEAARDQIPLFRALCRDASSVAEAVQRCAEQLRKRLPGLEISTTEVQGEVGGGTLPGFTVPSHAICLRHANRSAEKLAASLRSGDVPVIGRIQEGRLLLDMRGIEEEEEGAFLEAVIIQLEGDSGP
jgi:L-seryl-tRNA(Ser) seleniumtransferase